MSPKGNDDFLLKIIGFVKSTGNHCLPCIKKKNAGKKKTQIVCWREEVQPYKVYVLAFCMDLCGTTN